MENEYFWGGLILRPRHDGHLLSFIMNSIRSFIRIWKMSVKNGLLKDNFKADYDAFVLEYKALENRLREGVYTFGFLRK